MTIDHMPAMHVVTLAGFQTGLVDMHPAMRPVARDRPRGSVVSYATALPRRPLHFQPTASRDELALHVG